MYKHHHGSPSPEMALLGQLYGAPSHGYDLYRRVTADLGHVWSFSQSQAYAILKRLEKRGDITVEEILQKKLPSRQMLHITSLGSDRFLEWMEASSGGSTIAIQFEFVTRLYFLSIYRPEKLIQACELQRADIESQIAWLEKIRSELPGEPSYNRISLDLRLKQLNTVMEWLDECQKNFHQKVPQGQEG